MERSGKQAWRTRFEPGFPPGQALLSAPPWMSHPGTSLTDADQGEFIIPFLEADAQTSALGLDLRKDRGVHAVPGAATGVVEMEALSLGDATKLTHQPLEARCA